jgi:hypothetical protein
MNVTRYASALALFPLLCLSTANASAAQVARGELEITMVVPPAVSIGTDPAREPALSADGSAALGRLHVSANDSYELRVASRHFSGETIRVNGKKVVLSPEGSEPLVRGQPGRSSVALNAARGFNAEGRDGVIQVSVYYP